MYHVGREAMAHHVQVKCSSSWNFVLVYDHSFLTAYVPDQSSVDAIYGTLPQTVNDSTSSKSIGGDPRKQRCTSNPIEVRLYQLNTEPN